MRALALSLLLPGLALSQPPDPFAGLAFLVGEWTATGGGKPGEAVRGGFTLRPELGGAVLVRRNRAEYDPRPGQARGEVHEDLMVIHPEGGALKATYFDNEGHVIRYAVTAEPGRATLAALRCYRAAAARAAATHPGGPLAFRDAVYTALAAVTPQECQ